MIDKATKHTNEKIEKMTVEQAKFFKILRVDQNCTWREIHDYFMYLYPNCSMGSSHAIGQEICEKSHQILKEGKYKW